MATYTTENLATGESKLLEKAKRCFKQAVEAESKQREREREDLRFQIPDLQWDEGARAQRSGGTTATQVIPARPILSISKLDQPIQLVLNQARSAKLGVNIHPVSEKADDDTAEVMQGIYRRIERDSNADQARLWALDRATKCGRGAYRVNTKWDEDAPDTGDQEIVIERVLYQDMVYFDPSASKPDFSDGEYAFVAAWVPLKTFKRLYTKADLSSEDDRTFSELSFSEPEWVKGDGDERAVLVCEYFYKEHNSEVIEFGGRKRDRDKVTVKWCKMTATEVLEEQDWNGKYIPLIPVIGRELQPFSSERRWVGMIGPSKDGQKLYNFAASTLVERMAMEPKTPFIADPKQIEGYEDQWKQANTRNFPYLPFNAIINGQVVPPPARAQLDQTGMSLAMMALQEADQFIQATTSIYDPSLGRNNPRDKSGIAIQRLQSQSDAGTSHYLASLADVSMTYEARVILDLIPAIYDRPGRIVRILGGEDESRTVMLNAPHTMDADGRPVLAPPGMPIGAPGQQGTPGMQAPPKPKTYNLKEGTYSISVTIGKSFQTRLEQGQTEIGDILSAQPALMPLIGATYFRFRDFPGSKEIADILKKVRDKEIPGLEEGKDGQPTPEQLQAKVQSMQQAGQELQEQLKQAMQALETDQAKQQAQIRKAEIDAQKDLELQKMRDATAIAVAQINAAAKGALQETQAQNEELATGLDQAFEGQENQEDRAHEVALEAMKLSAQRKQAEMGMQHEGQQAERDKQHESQQAERGMEHEDEQSRSGQEHEAAMAERAAQQAKKEPSK